MKKFFLFCLLVIGIFGATGCGTLITVTPIREVSYQRTQPQQTIAYSVVIDNQTATTATLIVDGDIRRSIPASIVTKYGMDCRGRFFIVKFDDGKSFNQKIFAGGDEMVTITISERRGKKRVRFEKIKSNQCRQRWPRRDRYYDYYRDRYRDRYRYRYHYRW